ncbi:MAG TPA: choice-of-anchor D domain-containing protein [Candidatus Angelobacter sp.]|nr:choice-of-anchor D domain-containing protein [Candidatus Angelobacter sp.]
MTGNRAILLMAVMCMVVVAILPASAQSNVSDLSISATISPNPALPGSTVSYFVNVQNLGPNVGLDPGVITGTLPAGVTASSCFARLYGAFRIVDGTCVVAGQSITASIPATIFPYATSAEQYLLFFDAVLTPSAPNGGAVYSSTFSVSGASHDPNLANNSITAVFTTPAPLSVTVNPKQVSFGYVALNQDSSSLTISVTNSGKSGFVYTPTLTGDFFESDNSCAGSHLRGVTISAFVAPGATCVSTLIFQPTGLGPAHGTITLNENDSVGQSAQQVVQLSGIGSNIAFQPQRFIFEQPQIDGTTSSSVGLSLINVGSIPVPIGEIQTSTSFSQTNDCGSVVQPQSSCEIFVSFSPTVAGQITGTLTVPAQGLSSPLAAALQGTGSAVELTPSPLRPLDLGSADLGTDSDPSPVTLTNVSTQPLRLNGVSASGAGFREKDDCPRRLHPGESCTIYPFFRATIDEGPAKGSLIVDAQDPAGPQTFQLTATGIGIRHNVVLLHYDYMVAADHTHDPEVVAPGAIQAVVDAFARHGIRVIVDPRHTAIPETDVTVFGPADCSKFFGFHSVNFYDLKAQYFHSTNPRVHYSIFAHFIAQGTSGFGDPCDPFAFSGLSELPGQNFVNSEIAGFLLPEGAFTPSMARMALASSYMHELGHNLGLHHGGGIGPLGTNFDDFQRNFKPNYISVMNYNYLGTGIPVADAVGSTNLKSCSLDQDCGDGALCTDTALGAPFPAKACFRLDYSRQLLPAAGNTPGALDENGNLDETAGLGSGNSDITFFTDAACNGQIVPSNGPLDFDGDGSATNTHATADLIPSWWLVIQQSVGFCHTGIYSKLGGFDDWAALTGKIDDIETQNSLDMSAQRDHAQEVDIPTLKDKHVLYPLRQVAIAIHPGCGLPSAPIAPGQPGSVTVAVLGSASLDVTQIDPQSLRLHGVVPMNTSIADVNGDGLPDLVATFDLSQIHLSPQATTVRLSGWFTSSQRFFASAPITIVTDMNAQPAACRN